MVVAIDPFRLTSGPCYRNIRFAIYNANYRTSFVNNSKAARGFSSVTPHWPPFLLSALDIFGVRQCLGFLNDAHPGAQLPRQAWACYPTQARSLVLSVDSVFMCPIAHRMEPSERRARCFHLSAASSDSLILWNIVRPLFRRRNYLSDESKLCRQLQSA